jgi:hypothetical protein
MKNKELDADVNTLALAYEDIQDKKSKYQIALFCRNLRDDDNVELSEAEEESVVNMILKEGLVDDEKDILVEKFPNSSPVDDKASRELTEQVDRLMLLDQDAFEAYGEYRNDGFTPRAALERVLTSDTVEAMENRQKNGHPLDN